jgi:hypothetical protein
VQELTHCRPWSPNAQQNRESHREKKTTVTGTALCALESSAQSCPSDPRWPDSHARYFSSLERRRSLQHSPSRLLLRAAAHHVVLDVDRLDARSAAGTVLAGVAMDRKGHRHLFRNGAADDLLVVAEGAAQHLVPRRAERLHRLGVEVRGPLERRQARGPQDLVDPGAADSGDRPLVAQEGMEVAGWSSRPANSSSEGAGNASGQRGDRLVGGHLLASQELRPRPLLGADPWSQLAPVRGAHQDPGAAVVQRGATVE